MKRMMMSMTALALALALMCGAAFATPIEIANGTVTVSAVDVQDGKETELTLGSFHLVGREPEGSYLVYDGEKLYDVEADALEMVISVPESVPTLGELETFAMGTRGEDIVPMQRALIAFGYLGSMADGDFGPATESAVKMFQEAAGLEVTGQADEVTRLLIDSIREEPIPLEGRVPPEVMFAPLLERTEADLQPLMDSGLIFSYDEFTGEGFIADRSAVTTDASGGTDLDKYELSLRFGLLTREEGDGVTFLPALEISCLCVRRPMMGKLTMKVGGIRDEAAIEGLTVSLEGIYTVEKGLVFLTDRMVEALAGAAEAGELKLRIEGQYHSFDIAVDDLDAAARIGALARQLAG